jgi:hypothetical protein
MSQIDEVTMSAPIEVLRELKRKKRQTFEQEMEDIDMLIAAQEKREASRNSGSDVLVLNNDLATGRIENVMPISDAIVHAINNGVGTPQLIHSYLSEKMSINTTTNSVNTRLSKLKAAGKISHNGRRWLPAKSSGPELAVPNPDITAVHDR